MSQINISLKLLSNYVNDSIIITDATGLIIWVNHAFTKISGYPLDEIIGKKPASFLQGPESSNESKKALSSAIANRAPCVVDIVNYHKSGTPYTAEISLNPIFDENGVIQNFVATQPDVTIKRKLFQESIEFKAYKQALDQQAIVSMADLNGDITFVNAKFCEISGYKESELLGKNHRQVNSSRHSRRFFKRMWRDISSGKIWQGEICNKAKSGTFYWVDTTIVPVLDGNKNIIRYVSIRYDITERKNVENELLRTINIDQLTGIFNRSYFYNELENVFKTDVCSPYFAKGLLVLFDLDNFKALNDKLGHRFGDMVLSEMGDRLASSCDMRSIVCRMGGDEFAALIPISDPTEEQFNNIIKLLHQSLSEPIMILDKEYTPSISIGVASYPEDASTPQELLVNADMALNEAKKKRGRWVNFDAALKEKQTYRKYVKSLLSNALEMDLFTIVMQPICSMENSEHVGFEILVRLSDNGKPIPPDVFIPLAEESRLIVDIGKVVMQKAMSAFNKMLSMGLEPGKLALNVAAPEFKNADFVENVIHTLAKYELAPSLLIIEVTETALIGRSSDKVAKAIVELQDIGIQVALDDFGTGYSSLSHLREFKVNKIKIDKSFVNDLEKKSEDRALVAGVIQLAKRLGLDTVAEGVENSEQRQILASFGCEYLQGYLHSRPLTVEDAILFLQTQNTM